jgi:hypothetical protein
MANEIRDAFNTVYVDGPSGSATQPQKSDIRSQVGGAIQTQFDGLKALTDAIPAIAVQADEAVDTANDALAIAITGIQPPKASVRILMTTNVVIASALENGDTLDGLTLATNNRIALTGQTAPAENGVWVVQASGSAVRSTDMDASSEIAAASFTVDAGTHASETWGCSTPAPITVGTTALTFVRSASASPTTAEVIAARGGSATLGGRLDASLDSLKDTLTQHLGRVADPTTTTGGASSGTFMFRDPVTERLPLSVVRVMPRVSGNIILKQLRLNVLTGTYSQIAAATVAATTGTGLNVFTPANFGSWIFEPGDWLGWSHTTAVGAVSPETFPDGGADFVGAGDVTSFTLASAHNGVGFTYQINADFGGFVQTVSAMAFDGQQDTIDDLIGPADYVLGRQSAPITGSGTALNYSHIQNTPAPYDQVLDELFIWLPGATSIFHLRRYGAPSGSPGSLSFPLLASVALRARAVGLNHFTQADFGLFPVAKGEYLGGFAPTTGGGNPANTAETDEGNGFFQVSGETNPLVTTTPVTAFRLQWQFKLRPAGPRASAVAFKALEARVTALEGSASTILNCYGDSMTAGSGGTAYPTQLATLLGRAVNNRGVGGQRAPDIFSRWGSFPILVPALTIPTSGSVDFTVSGFNGAFDQADPINENNTAGSGTTFSGVLAGVPGVLSRVSGTYPGSYVYRFTRTGSGSAVSVIAGENFFIDMSDNRDQSIPIFWAGRNSIGLQNISGQSSSQQFDKVIAWHERAIALLKGTTNTRRFLIMGPSNRNDEYSGSAATVVGAALTGSQSYDVIMQIENELRQKWPRSFVNQRGYLVSKYDSGTPQDVIDHGRDVPPSTKRADLLHYNTSGYGDVATVLAARIAQFGY